MTGRVVREFAAEVASLEKELARTREVAVARLRRVQEAWARSIVGLGADGNLVAQVRAAVEEGLEPGHAAAAAEHLAAAERWQWEIGTWSTGAGEGLASMFEVRSLQLARAWLLAVPGANDTRAAAEALRLADEVDRDPNDVAARIRHHVAALRERLGH